MVEGRSRELRRRQLVQHDMLQEASIDAVAFIREFEVPFIGRNQAPPRIRDALFSTRGANRIAAARADGVRNRSSTTCLRIA